MTTNRDLLSEQPNEIIEHIYALLPALAALSLERSSRRFYDPQFKITEIKKNNIRD